MNTTDLKVLKAAFKLITKCHYNPALSLAYVDGKKVSVHTPNEGELEVILQSEIPLPKGGYAPKDVLIVAEKGEAFTLKEDGKVDVTLRNWGAMRVIMEMPHDSYWPAPEQSGNLIATLVEKETKDLCAVAEFMLDDELRPNLNGACIRQQKGLLTATATDAHRVLRLRLTEDVDNGNDGKEWILPARSINVLKGFSAIKGLDSTEIRYDDSEYHTKLELRMLIVDRDAGFVEVNYSSTFTDARYPDTDGVFPKEYTKVCEVELGQLEHILKEAKDVIKASRAIYLPMILFHFNKDVTTYSLPDENLQAIVEAPLPSAVSEMLKGESVSICFDPLLLLKSVTSMKKLLEKKKDCKMRMHLDSSQRLMVATLDNVAGADFLLMSISLKS